jgi:pilus assembly protein CpaE
VCIVSSLSKIHVLVLRDELQSEDHAAADRAEELLSPNDPRVRLTISKAAYGEGLRSAERHQADVIVLDGVLGDSVVMVHELDDALPNTPLLVILDEIEGDRIHDCYVAGARGCLVRPVHPDVLVRTIVQAHEKALRRTKQLEAERLGGNKGGKLLAVRGAKGGVGCTTIATNLAVALSRLGGRRVVLVDAHFMGGDVPVTLDIAPNRSLADLIPHLDALDDELLETALVQHPSGVNVLVAPLELERAESITPEQFQRVLEALRERFDYVVVDTSPIFDQNSLTALDTADLLLLVCTPDIAALKNASRFIQLATEFHYAEDKLRLVVNRRNAPGAISRSDMETHLQYRMSFEIPNDFQAVIGAMNRGQPLVTYRRRCRAARAMERLARTVHSDRGWMGEARISLARRLIRRSALPGFRPRVTVGEAKRELA